VPGELPIGEWLPRRGANVSPRLRKGSDLILFAANRAQDLNELARLKTYLKPRGAIWVIRPKGVAAITERQVMSAAKAAGLVDVKVASFSPTHTAEKLVIPVGLRGGS
jgi:hypothetical protein